MPSWVNPSAAARYQNRARRLPSDLGSANGDRRAERRVEKIVGYPPLSEMGDSQRREFHEALLDAGIFEDRWVGRGKASGAQAEISMAMVWTVRSARSQGSSFSSTAPGPSEPWGCRARAGCRRSARRGHRL